MENKKELLEMAVINLTCENAELRERLEKERETADRYRRWWMSEQEESNRLRTELESLTSHLPEGSDANPSMK